MHAILLALCCVISGHVQTAGGAPLSDVHLVLTGATTQDATSDRSGTFSITASPGQYRLSATAKGYAPVLIDLKLDRDRTVDVALESLDAPTLRTIGTVSVDGRLAPVRGAVPSISVTRAEMERLGEDRVIDGLATVPGTTFPRPDGGAASAIAVVALRGPDPSESLVALDGQLLNDGNTGDLDLSRFPVAAFSSADVTEGLGPEDSNGSNTFGGAVNFISLRPTSTPHVAFSASGGSFGQTETWLNATGSHGRLGYGLALDDQHETGYVNQVAPLYSSVDPGCAPCATQLGSSVASHLGLGNLTWTFSQRAAVTARVFLLGNERDQSAAINGIDGNTGSPTFGAFIGPGSETFAQVVRAYQLRGRMPLGAGELIADVDDSDNSVSINGNASNPAYDVTHADRRYNGGLTWQRDFENSQFALGGYTRYESLDFIAPGSTDGTPISGFDVQPALGQTINVLYMRGGFTPTPKLRLDGGVFESHYTTFGSNLDGRLAAIYNTDPKTALRFSMGTGFRAPLLIERYQFPLNELGQDALGVFVGQGSPNETPEHAMEYELGVSHQLESSTLDFSLYRTNLRNPVEIFYPLARAQSGACMGQTPSAPVPGCISYQSNVGNAVYQGAEVRYVQRFVPQHLFLTAMYGLNVAYPKDLTADFSNPTSAANLTDNVQFQGIPQQQGSLGLDWTNAGWHAAAEAVFRGNNNELDQGPFTLINAAVGFKVNDMTDLTLAGNNIFNSAAGRFTTFGGGVPYTGFGGAQLPTDRLALEPFGLRVILTIRK
ncbi:MAG TPA: TonB-dependent receptor [Candidatus Baltobacteraceae bacterium]|nr:TonB-dependent receptor [Candidatus Baltobacteraceae bacterium]